MGAYERPEGGKRIMKFIVTNLKLPLDHSEEALRIKIAKETRLEPSAFSYRILRKSIDSRKGEVAFIYSAIIETRNFVAGRNVQPYKEPGKITIAKRDLAYRPVVIGFGPAGIFAALVLARSGVRPIVLERGKAVAERAQDVLALRHEGVLNPDSNVCYGEGGAGTFSDGKLNNGGHDAYTGFVMEEFVRHGAPVDILTDALPHIGTDYLQNVVKSFRQEIIDLGGEIRFQCRFTQLDLTGGKVTGVRYLDAEGNERTLETETVFLAVGHSPYDTMLSLAKSGVLMTPRDFAIGVRIEHPQREIDEANYHRGPSKELPPSSYRAVTHLRNGRSVYSFCMCPGGYVFNSSTELGGVLTNGMSDHARDAINGNAALLVNVTTADYLHGDPLDGFLFRSRLEKAAFLADRPYFAPAETVGSFQKGLPPLAFGKVSPSYEPGVYLASLASFLPSFVSDSLKEALPILAATQSFFKDPDAVLTGFETRSSSPVRIPRNEFGEANIPGLFPLGEGASYAGGITSASLDGLKIALGFLGRGY